MTDDTQLHREADRQLGVADDDPYAEWDAEPTHEKWRKGGQWR